MTPTASKTSLEANHSPAGGEAINDREVSVSTPSTTLHYLRLLWSHRRFLLRASSAGFAFATLVAFLIPVEYQSTARLMPPDTESQASGMAMIAAMSGKLGGLGSLAGDILGMKSSGALFVGILRSDAVEQRLVDRFQLKKVYGKKLNVDAREKLAANSSASDDIKDGIITITVSDGDKQRAVALASAFVEELNRIVNEQSTSGARRERIFLEERLQGVRRDLEASEKEFGQFASKNTAINIQEQGKAMVDAAATLMGQLIAAQSELKGLEQIYSESNVRVRSVRARISELQNQLQRMGGKEDEARAGTGQETESLYPSIRKLPLLGVTYADLYRNTRIQEAVYETLTQEYELAKVQEAKETPSVKILDPPSLPEKKSFPPRMEIVFLGTLLPFALGAIWVLGHSNWQQIDAQDPRKEFGSEVFQTFNAYMPWATPNGSRLQARSHRIWKRLLRWRSQSEEQA